MNVNQLFLYATGTGAGEYPCVHLDRSSPEEAEAYVEIGDGLEPIEARVWMTHAQLMATPSAFRQGTKALGIKMLGNSHDKDNPTAAPVGRTIIFSEAFYLIKASLVSVGVNEAVYDVRMSTIQRWWKYKILDKAWNVLSSDKRSFIAGAVSSSSPTTFASIFNTIKAALGITVTGITPTANPHNFVTRGSAALALRRLLRPLGYQLVCNPYNSSLEYSLVAFDYADPTEPASLKACADVAGVGGSNTAYSDQLATNNIGPENLEVLFPISPAPTASAITDLVEKYTTIVHANPAAGAGLAGTKDRAYVGDHFDVTGKTYTESLAAIAAERGAAYFRRVLIPHNIYLFAGGLTFLPGKTIRKVRISMDMAGWFTLVECHGLATTPREGTSPNLIQTPQFPEFNEGLGSQVFPRDDGAVDILPGTVLDRFLARITDHAALGATGRRWTYSWTEVQISADSEAAVSGGRTGTAALNLNEIHNVTNGVQGTGIDESGADYPAGFSLQPIGRDSSAVVVEMLQVADVDGETRYVFNVPNGHDGTCDA